MGVILDGWTGVLRAGRKQLSLGENCFGEAIFLLICRYFEDISTISRVRGVIWVWVSFGGAATPLSELNSDK